MCTHIAVYACMYACMCVCMYVDMYVRMFVCISIYVRRYRKNIPLVGHDFVCFLQRLGKLGSVRAGTGKAHGPLAAIDIQPWVQLPTSDDSRSKHPPRVAYMRTTISKPKASADMYIHIYICMYILMHIYIAYHKIKFPMHTVYASSL